MVLYADTAPKSRETKGENVVASRELASSFLASLATFYVFDHGRAEYLSVRAAPWKTCQDHHRLRLVVISQREDECDLHHLPPLRLTLNFF